MRLDLAYDGTDFHGWARQPGLRSVQGTVEDALATVARRPVPLTVAGRTDAGVHALGQVAHLDLPSDLPDLPVLRRRLDGLLPADARVTGLQAVPAAFDARFAALSRAYRYRVTDGVPDPLRRRDTLAWRRPLDVAALAASAVGLLGEHDFAAYCRRREGATTIRRLIRLDAERDQEGVVVVAVEADAFCHQMVRSLVGALLTVGEGRRGPDWPAGLLAWPKRATGVPVLPAHGLTLVAVRYPPEEQYAVRVAVTHQRRVLPDPLRADPAR